MKSAAGGDGSRKRLEPPSGLGVGATNQKDKRQNVSAHLDSRGTVNLRASTLHAPAQLHKEVMAEPAQPSQQSGVPRDEDDSGNLHEGNVCVGNQQLAAQVFFKWCSLTSPILGHSVCVDDRNIVLGDLMSAKDVRSKYRGV